jgi:multidrug efflux pump subunit AcrA (membrane-fusion protein)
MRPVVVASVAVSLSLRACIPAGTAPPEPTPTVLVPPAGPAAPTASSTPSPDAAPAAPPMRRDVVAVSVGELDDVIEASATLTPVDEVHVTARVSGTVTVLRTQVGARVHKGDVLATITPDDPPGARPVEATALRDGVVLECPLHLGDHAAARSSVLARTAELDKLTVRIAVPEARAALVKAGQTFALRVPAFPDRIFRGQVARIAPGLDVDHALPVEGPIDNLDRTLIPGMSGTAVITVGTRTGAVMVPRAAVVDQDGHPTVFVLQDTHVHARAVGLGLHGGFMVEITSGLSVGHRVVTPAAGLVDGAELAAPR